MTGSPSSLARVFIAIQSSRRLDKPTDVIVVSGIFLSSEVLGRPCTSCEIKMYIAPFVYNGTIRNVEYEPIVHSRESESADLACWNAQA